MNPGVEHFEDPAPTTLPPRQLAIGLKLGSWMAFALVVGLLVTHQLLLQPALMRLSSDAPVINIAGRQRMLSQKLAKTALALQVALDQQSRRERRNELEGIVNEWTRAHRGLLQGDFDLNLPGNSDPRIQNAFVELEPHFKTILASVQVLLEPIGKDGELQEIQKAAIQQILNHEDEFLRQMHALVGLFAIDARDHVRHLQLLGWGIVGLIAALLLAVQLIIIRPALEVVASRVATSEYQYQRLVESMNEGVIVEDVAGRIRFTNRRVCELLGLPSSELVGIQTLSLLAETDHSRFQQIRNSVSTPVEPVEFAFRTSSGMIIETMASIQPLIDDRGQAQGFLLVVTDLTARKQAEQRSRDLLEQLVHADRLKSLGELAAGMAHEINQPLAAIANYAEACLASLVDPAVPSQPLIVPLQRILAAALRGGEIIRRSRRFVQRRPHEVQPESINDLIREVEQLCRPEALRLDVKVELNLASVEPVVPVDGIQIQQVLTNLIQNALIAMESTPADQRILKVTSVFESDQHLVRIQVRDSGAGFGQQDVERLFEPFVTTRRDGLGLGLAISRNIVQSHGGTIEAMSNADRGATFQFTLPLVAQLVEVPWSSLKEETTHA